MTTGRAILVSLVLALSAFVGARADDWGSRIVVAARSQVGVTTRYVPDYRVIAYPNGDVPIKEGVCTDVVIRALRTALGIDLQRLVHEDMAAHFSSYPTIWQRKSPDSNIDHRRVQNLRVSGDADGNYRPIRLIFPAISSPARSPVIMTTSWW
jgi:uncharacterized protein YijF (DUF1287 family)